MAKPSTIDYVEAIAVEGAALITAVRHGALDSPVVTCPGWDLTGLSAHIATTWRWTAQIVDERLTKPPPYDVPAGLEPEQVVPYLEGGLTALLDALRSCPPDAEVWGFGPRPRTASFWRRRQAMEAAIHRVDAEIAVGETGPVDATLAADGVGEFIEAMLPRLYYGQDPPPGRFQVTATDTGETWAQGDPLGSVGTLSGCAEDLFLVLWKRRDPGTVDAGGDPDILAGWRALGSP